MGGIKTVQIKLGLSLMIISASAFAWSEKLPVPPAIPTPSSTQLQSTPPANLMQTPAQVDNLPSVQMAKAWVLPVSPNLPVADAKALLVQVRQQGYPVYLQTDGQQAVVYVGPEVDLARLQAAQSKLQKTLTAVGKIQEFDPYQQGSSS
jgi:cell division septation protein DedD